MYITVILLDVTETSGHRIWHTKTKYKTHAQR